MFGMITENIADYTLQVFIEVKRLVQIVALLISIKWVLHIGKNKYITINMVKGRKMHIYGWDVWKGAMQQRSGYAAD